MTSQVNTAWHDDDIVMVLGRTEGRFDVPLWTDHGSSTGRGDELQQPWRYFGGVKVLCQSITELDTTKIPSK